MLEEQDGGRATALPGKSRLPRMLADCMLGRLAKWLRVLGYDAAYVRRIEDDALIALALREGRTLLTRDTRLAARRSLRAAGTPMVLVASSDPVRQLAEVLETLGLEPSPERLLSRCIVCNEPTRPADPAEVAGRVPPYVLATQERFSRCPACSRVYWRATHVDAMLARLGLPPG